MKIPSLFMREEAPGASRRKDLLVVDRVTPGCEWVIAGEGVATVKRDGTAVMIENGRVFKRYDAKHGKTPPSGFRPAQEPDPKTGHWPGWLECSERESGDAWILLAVANTCLIEHAWDRSVCLPDGTYEACGPMINGNNERVATHILLRHGAEPLARDEAPTRTFAGLRDYLALGVMEGIVWHHPDGRMAKIKTRDFGHAWPVRTS